MHMTHCRFVVNFERKTPTRHMLALVAMLALTENMKVFELTVDGKLTRELIREVGDTMTVKERIKAKSYGLGHLKFKDGNSILARLYERENNTIKTHFDWTANGAVIRMRTMKRIYAVGLKDEQIGNIELTKTKDYVFAIPLTPFWTLMKLGVNPSIARWFAIRPERFSYGPAYIDISLTDDKKLIYEIQGDMWSDCLSTFGTKRIAEKVKVVDRRRTATNNVYQSRLQI
jgi:hypothetical protein